MRQDSGFCQLHEVGWRLSGGCVCVLYTLKRESGCLSINCDRLAAACKGCVSFTGGRLAVVYNGVLRQSLVENWRLSVGVYSVNYMRRDDGYLSVT
jgi:hypothetical protein